MENLDGSSTPLEEELSGPLPSIPIEILSAIFSFIPFSSDWLNIKLVCKVWNQLGDHVFNPSENNNFAIKFASQNGYEIDHLLQDTRVDPSANNNYAIKRACRSGHLKVVDRLLEDDRVNPNASENYALRWAAKNGHVQVVHRLLQDKRVDPNAVENYAIKNAIYYEHWDIVHLLLDDERIDLTDCVRELIERVKSCLLYTSPSPRDA
eukprot:TRINITY_DN13513_c0_g1_i1.p1 TRINITY_DN13513_c0_g1~~TRINITY_DN13513_c0_g1_i1.p1  ORF type:complete len:208 (+),score=48.63 TRINITY_DN13513_c0_g1_i1:111-734(+)